MNRVLPQFFPQVSLRPLARLQKWSALARQRSALGKLDDAALDDIGLSRDAAQSEASRPFWDAPATWRN